MLIDFELLPLESIEPWGEGEARSLSWFTLTDGDFHLNVADQKLFQYTDDVMAIWKEKGAEDGNARGFVDYQVARLHTDLLNMVPDVLQPLPDEVYRLVETFDRAKDWAARLDDSALEGDAMTDAAGWWWARTLDCGYLGAAPDIWFFTANDTVTIRWDCEGREFEGHPVWTATEGEIQMPVAAFQSEIETFHSRLIAEMADRLAAIQSSNLFPGVSLDAPSLAAQHAGEATRLDVALKGKPAVPDWENVISANSTFV